MQVAPQAQARHAVERGSRGDVAAIGQANPRRPLSAAGGLPPGGVDQNPVPGLAAQAIGEPVTIGGFAQTAATAPTSIMAFPTEAATIQPLLTTPDGVDTGLTAVAVVNGVPVTSGPITNLRGGYGNTTTISSSSFGGSVLVSYGSDLPIVGPDYARQLPGSGLSNPAPIPYVGADRADAIAAAARSGMEIGRAHV